MNFDIKALPSVNFDSAVVESPPDVAGVAQVAAGMPLAARQSASAFAASPRIGFWT
ncbi:hypothetical protein [Achromobacter sp. NFACC18-2]|uniref:hypothetical protein n=1 Tax=Achromobacter sp. NFACC18-2 TaxID=1564112 RepID=UPI001587D77F|nr:hypothetical protein [Achromobacter sp. NFACC18-2]